MLLISHIKMYYMYTIYLYRIIAVTKVKTEMIANIAASLTRRAAILAMMYTETNKTGVIALIGHMIM